MQWFQRAGTRRWAIIAETTNISIFTDLKPTEIMGSNHQSLNINWTGLTAYAYPLIALLHRVIQKSGNAIA